MRLIDADALKARLHGCMILMPNGEKCTAERAIDTQGTIEPEVRHGYWIELPKAFDKNENPCKCSACGHVLSFYNHYPKSKFCPNCGAKMDGEQPLACNPAHSGAVTAEQFEAIWNDHDGEEELTTDAGNNDKIR